MNYVDKYLRLEDRASGAESRAEEYRQRAEQDRWEQCRIAYEAVESGEYSTRMFAAEVGKSHQVIGRQCRMWEKHGRSASGPLPEYVISLVDGDDETVRKQLSNAKAVLRSPEAARQLLADPVARAVASEAIEHHRKADPAARPKVPTGDDAFLRCVDDMARVKQSLVRLIENVNEGRKNGYLTPAVLREFADDVALYLDAIREIADSRGLTDEALYEWIGEE